MGKKAKEHRRKVEKRNRRVEQEKYMMKKQIDKLFEQRLENVSVPDLNVKLGDKDLPFSLVEDSGVFPNTKLNEELNNLDFTESNNDEVVDIEVIDEEPTYDSAGFSIEDRNETTGSI
jgi:hypothetical protein